MIGILRKRNTRRSYLPIVVSMLGMVSLTAAATKAGFAVTETGGKKDGAHGKKNLPGTHFSLFDVVHEQRVRFAADHGVADPTALVAAVRHSPLAHLLISVAIEESRGDPLAIGSAGEQGAWQVIAAEWGRVPKDLCGQAHQAERIIRSLLMESNGDKIKALARYNGGPTPPGKSFSYAERIVKRASYLQVAVQHLAPKSTSLSDALSGYPGSTLVM